MKIISLSPEQFNTYAKTHRYRNYYQTTSYGNVMLKFGFNVQYLGIADDSNNLIGASLILYREVFMHNKAAYAPRGILFNYNDATNLNDLATKLKELLGKQGFMSLRIDPYITSTVRDAKGNIMNFNNQKEQIMSNLENAGFEYHGETIFFEDEKPRWETLVVLNKDIRAIFANFDKRTRHKIRKAANSGVEIARGRTDNLTFFYNLIKNKSNKPIEYYKELINNYQVDMYYAKLNTESYVIDSRKAYEREIARNDVLAKKIQSTNLDSDTRNSFLNKKMESDKLLSTYKNNMVNATELLKNNPQGLIIATAMVITYDNAAYLVIDGFDQQYSSLNANYLLKWRMIDDYNKKGFKYLNMNAIVGEFTRKNKYSGLNEMKLGFNPIITEYLGQFDIVLNNFTYNLYKSLNKDK